MEQDGRQKAQATQLLKQSFSKRMCLAPEALKSECDGNIIRAHVVSKSSNLSYIAEKGHVYTLKPSMSGLQKTSGRPEPELVGINIASTFTGFCSHHDNSLFSEIEGRKFEADEQQTFLLGFRALSRELFTKIASRELFEGLKKLNRAKIDPMFRTFIEAMAMGTEAALRDLGSIKSKYENDLVKGSFHDYWYLSVELREPLPMVCSGALLPSYDFSGGFLQDLADLGTVAEEVTFGSVVADDVGYLVFCGRKGERDIARHFISSFMEVADELKPSAFIDMACVYCETVCMSPVWWSNIDASERKRVVDMLNIGIDPTLAVANDILVTSTPYSLENRPIGFRSNIESPAHG